MFETDDLFPPDYFNVRGFRDSRRMESYEQEWCWIKSRYDPARPVCDVGCATGDFLEGLAPTGSLHGMEISRYAQEVAESKGIDFNHNVVTESNFFGLVILRGVIQHVKRPYDLLEDVFDSLIPGGFFAILMTPNTNSRYFNRFKTLPAIDKERDLMFPSDVSLAQNLRQFGFVNLQFRYPYRNSGYDKPMMDHLQFAWSSLFRRRDPIRHAFPGNMLSVICQKPSS